jgi:hypothetical protein
MKLQRSSSPVFFRSALLVLASVFTAQAASAMSLRELRALEQSSEQGGAFVQYYLVGVMEGALEAHAQAVRNGAQAVICLNGRRLEPDMALGLYQTELKRYAELYEADMPVPLVLTHALATVYSC